MAIALETNEPRAGGWRTFGGGTGSRGRVGTDPPQRVGRSYNSDSWPGAERQLRFDVPVFDSPEALIAQIERTVS